jgi:CheY-like chemotaxis protein
MSRTLIIEDNLIWHGPLKEPIESRNNKIDIVQSLEKAKDHLSHRNYDLIIADLVLLAAQSEEGKKFDSLGDLVYFLDQDRKRSRIPIIVVTGHRFDYLEMVKALNDYPGRIWGWHRKVPSAKESFDQVAYQKSVQTTLRIKQMLPYEPSGLARPGLTVLGLFGLVSGVAWLFNNSSSSQAQPLLITTATVTVILGFLTIMLSNFSTIKQILPSILHLLGRQ